MHRLDGTGDVRKTGVGVKPGGLKSPRFDSDPIGKRSSWIPDQVRNDELVVFQLDIATEVFNPQLGTTTTGNMFQMAARPVFRMLN